MNGSREDATTRRTMNAGRGAFQASNIPSFFSAKYISSTSRNTLFASSCLRANKILGGYGKR
jgi:hypothetical protein